jgi:stage V sporulation protein R
MRLFHVVDDPDEAELRVEAIHDERGYRKLRRSFARQYDVAWLDPDIEVVDVDLEGDRRLIVHHKALNRITLQADDARRVLQHLADLWGYDAVLKEIDPATGAILAEHHAAARPIFF